MTALVNTAIDIVRQAVADREQQLDADRQAAADEHSALHREYVGLILDPSPPDGAAERLAELIGQLPEADPVRDAEMVSRARHLMSLRASLAAAEEDRNRELSTSRAVELACREIQSRAKESMNLTAEFHGRCRRAWRELAALATQHSAFFEERDGEVVLKGFRQSSTEDASHIQALRSRLDRLDASLQETTKTIDHVFRDDAVAREIATDLLHDYFAAQRLRLTGDLDVPAAA